MLLRGKYPIEKWVLKKDGLEIGDMLAFWDDNTNMEKICTVTAPSTKMLEHKEFPNCIPVSIILAGEEKKGLLNFYKHVVYNVTGKTISKRSCSCGAIHTSNPKYHLSYCDFSK